jgi:hypothetical protein
VSVSPEERSPNRLYVGLEYHERAVKQAEQQMRVDMINAVVDYIGPNPLPSDVALIDHLKGVR